jgi:iron complex outermembrane receptor protein
MIRKYAEKSWLILLGLIGSQVPTALAESVGESVLASENDYFTAIPVVVTATRLAQPKQLTPASVSVIDRAMIEASGAVELVDIIRLVPGFQVSHLHGNLFTVSAHGTAAPWFSRIQVLIDGQSVYNTAFSGLDWANFGLALQDIEKIEVVRGPNIAAYGANAIQGTVNIITRQPFQDRGLLLQTTLGDPQRRDGVVRYAGEFAALDYRLTLEHRESSGFPERDDSTALNSLNFRGIYNPTAEDELDVHVGSTDSEMGVQLHSDEPNDDRSVNTDYQFLRWTRSKSTDESWYVQLSRDQYASDESSRFPGPFGTRYTFNNFDAVSERYDIELQHFWRPAQATRLAWGLGYRWDSLETFLIEDEDGVSDETSRVFANLESRLAEKLLLNIGGMYERSAMAGGSVSPRLGLNYSVSRHHTLRMAFARGHKHPSLLEEHWRSEALLVDGTPLFTYHISEGGLAPERRDVVEFGYLGRWWDERLNLDLRLYREEVDGAVIYAKDLACQENPFGIDWCYRVGNFMDYRAKGLEMEFSYRTSADNFVRFQYAYTDIDGEVPASFNPDSYVDLNLTAPRNAFGILASRRFDRDWQASLAWYQMDETYWYIDGDLIDEYSRLDLRLAKSIRFKQARATLEFIAQNLLEDYQEFSLDNHFETRLLFRAGLQLE